MASTPTQPEVMDVCHEWWERRYQRREERLDEEIRYLLDEEERRSEPAVVVERDRDEQTERPGGDLVEA